MTQIMGLLRLAPEIQKYILSMPKTAHRPPVTERALRPITSLPTAFGKERHSRDSSVSQIQLSREALQQGIHCPDGNRRVRTGYLPHHIERVEQVLDV